MRRLIATLLLVLLPAHPAQAQHNHGSGHADYQAWASGKVSNCCNNDDCGELRDDETRETNEGTEVRIDGEWCPVLREHFIVRGKSPDASVAHACVRKGGWGDACSRLLCYSGKMGL